MPNRERKTLRAWREAAGETQRKAAAAVGIHWTTWSLIETGKASTSIDVVNRIAEHFGCTLDDIEFPSISRAVA